MSWILIIKDIPVEKHVKPDLLGIYYGKVSKWFFEGERHINYQYYPLSDRVSEFKYTYKRGHYSRENCVCRDKQQALMFLNYYKNDEHDKIPDDILFKFKFLDDKFGLPDIEAQYKILTKGGEVCVNPEEYSEVKERLYEYQTGIGNEWNLHFFGGMETSNEFKQKLFYLNSRGVSKVDGIGMVLGEITRQDVCYMEPHPQLAEASGFF